MTDFHKINLEEAKELIELFDPDRPKLKRPRKKMSLKEAKKAIEKFKK